MNVPSRRAVAHVLYGGAHLFREETLEKIGRIARTSFETHAPDAATFARAVAIDDKVAHEVHARVTRKLASAPVEDYRIDFEDGYGPRSDEEEDGHLTSAASALAKLHARGALPCAIGFRIKPLAHGTRDRAQRTLERFLHTFVTERGERTLPSDFVVTLPKVRAPEEVVALVDLLVGVERALGLAPIAIELMIETPEALFAESGACALPSLVRAGAGRCTALHVGSYDLTASMGVAAHHQTLAHPLCDFAKHLMKATLSGSGIALSDGATTTMPIGATQEVHAAWRLHADNVRHGLRTGFLQGWDLHPAQIPARFGALYAFFLEALPAMRARLEAFHAESQRATRVGQAFDDRATGLGLENFFRTGRACGALTEEDVRGLSF